MFSLDQKKIELKSFQSFKPKNVSFFQILNQTLPRATLFKESSHLIKAFFSFVEIRVADMKLGNIDRILIERRKALKNKRIALQLEESAVILATGIPNLVEVEEGIHSFFIKDYNTLINFYKSIESDRLKLK